MRTLMILNMALAGFAIAATTGVTVDNYAIGGAGGTVGVGSTGQLTMVAGQAYADTQKVIGSQGILQGFWVEMAVPQTTQATPVAQPNTNGIKVSFHASDASLQFNVSAETQATVKLLTVDGKQVGATWTQNLHAGASQFTMSLALVGTTPMVFVVTVGNVQKTYRFTPSVAK